MRPSYRRVIAVSLFAAMPFIGSSCMMGMAPPWRGGGHHGRPHDHDTQPRLTLNQRLDSLIEQAVTDLTASPAVAELPQQTIAIGELRAEAPMDKNILEGKLTAQLVEKGRLAVVDRKRLKLLLDEQGLSLSGAIDANNAPKIGKLVGVDGFLVGAAVFNESQLVLNLKIISTESGIIIWAKEISE